MQALLQKQEFTPQQRINRLLGWDELQYGQFVYETGCHYLQVYIPCDDTAVDTLERSRIFWAWWKNHFRQRDCIFLSRVNMHAPLHGIIDYYRFMHDPERLVHSLSPHSTVLHESYAIMIGEFNHSQIINQ